MKYFAAGASGCPGNCLLGGSIDAHGRWLRADVVISERSAQAVHFTILTTHGSVTVSNIF